MRFQRTLTRTKVGCSSNGKKKKVPRKRQNQAAEGNQAHPTQTKEEPRTKRKEGSVITNAAESKGKNGKQTKEE